MFILIFSKDIEKYQLGVIYETGNVEQLKAAMKKLYEDKTYFEQCVFNLEEYKRVRDISLFSDCLLKIIHRELSYI